MNREFRSIPFRNHPAGPTSELGLHVYLGLIHQRISFWISARLLLLLDVTLIVPVKQQPNSDAIPPEGAGRPFIGVHVSCRRDGAAWPPNSPSLHRPSAPRINKCILLNPDHILMLLFQIYFSVEYRGHILKVCPKNWI